MAARIAVLGTDGYVGRHLARATEGCVHVGRRDLDWSSGRPQVRSLRLAESGHTHAVLAAGVTGVAACEADPERTSRVNVDAPLSIARQLRDEGVTPVCFSSDYVFDGTRAPYGDSAPRRPLQAYGRQKAALEEGMEKLDSALVVRLSKVYGSAPRGDLLQEMADKLARGEIVRAARDQCFNPISIGDAVRAVIALCDAGASGVVNVCGPQAWCRVELARAVASALDATSGLVEEISLDDLDEPFQRPKDTRMSADRLAELTAVRPAGVDGAIAALEGR